MAISLPKLTKQQQQYLAGGVVLIGVSGFLFFRFFWNPTSERIRKAEEDIRKISEEIDQAKKIAAQRAQKEAELLALNQAAIEAEKRLPKTKDVPQILVTLMALSKKHEVALTGFGQGGQKPQPYFVELSYPLTVRGTFHAIGRFLAAIALEERIYNVQNVNFGSATGDKGDMTISFTLVSYKYNG